MYAATYRFPNTAELLLRHGAQVNVQDKVRSECHWNGFDPRIFCLDLLIIILHHIALYCTFSIKTVYFIVLYVITTDTLLLLCWRND